MRLSLSQMVSTCLSDDRGRGIEQMNMDQFSVYSIPFTIGMLVLHIGPGLSEPHKCVGSMYISTIESIQNTANRYQFVF